MTYKEATEYMTQAKKNGISPGLATIEELCHRLGNPQDTLNFIHIAGTNGKGSVLNFLATILKTAGYRTGCFFSPAITEERERFTINNRMISKADFCRYLEMVKVAADCMVIDGLAPPTAFEIDTALSFLYFAEKECAIVVLETGMGGTFDATNIIKTPLISVITPISMDHAEYLGRTDAIIARHKAGIIKKGASVVCGVQSDEVYDVIAEKCRECRCSLHISPLEKLGRIHPKKPDYKNGTFRQLFTYGERGELAIIMAGEHQVSNAVLALDALSILAKRGFPVQDKDVSKGLLKAIWPGRFQMIAGKPPFIIDGAHNVAAAAKLADTLKIYFTNKRIIYIMGILGDKDYSEMIQRTCGLAEHIITVTPPDPRGFSGYELALTAAKWHPRTTSADSIAEACELATLLAGKDGIIVAFGSFTILDALKSVKRFSKMPSNGSAS